jgi:hypothetical protein
MSYNKGKSSTKTRQMERKKGYKMKRKIILFSVFWIIIIKTGSTQSFFPLNNVNPESPDIILSNPSAMAFSNTPQAFLGIQLLHLGIENDNFYNSIVSYVHPVGIGSVIGARLNYFNSTIFSQGYYSLIYGQKIIEDFFSIGLNTNLISIAFDTDKFFLFDFEDPILKHGTSKNSFSFGLSFFAKPVQHLHIGAALDHLNRPDISIAKSGIRKNIVYNFGISYNRWNIMPQLDIRMEGEEIFIQESLCKSFIDTQLNLIAGFNHSNKSGNTIFTRLTMRLGDLGLFYNFQLPVLSEFSQVSNGSHLTGIYYKKEKIPSIPDINLGEVIYMPHLPNLDISGVITCKDDIKEIEIIQNDQMKEMIECPANIQSYQLKKTIALEKGKNSIQILARTKDTVQKEKLFLVFEPLDPEIQFISAANDQVDSENYELAAQISDETGISGIEVWHNAVKVKEIQNLADNKSFQLSLPVKLIEGENHFKIKSYNRWKTKQDSTWIIYKSLESPPVLSLDSPQRPVSGSSSISLAINLDNHRSIDNVLIKLNGEIVDNIMIEKTQDTVKTKGLSRIVRKDVLSARTVDLKQTENVIEAIAFDREQQPRTSKTMRILYNPYANEIEYEKKIAVVIGINKYKDSRITNLDLAVSDADTVKNLLKNQFNFDEVHTLYNENANFNGLRNMISDKLLGSAPNDLIVFYFSGHGTQVMSRIGAETGYILPYDSEYDKITRNISMSFLSEVANQAQARDILFIIDACYSGLGIVEKPSYQDDFPGETIDYNLLKEKVSKPSRNIITAGGKKEQAVDGLFTRILKQALLGAADYNHDQYITSAELSFYLRSHVSEEALNKYTREQNPQFGSIITDRGELVLKYLRSR